MEENLKQKTVNSVAWSFIGSLAGRLIQFIITMVLARILSPSDYGLIGMLGFFMGIAGTFIDSGFSSALIQYKERTDKDYNTVFYINLGMSLLMYLILYICAPLIADFYQQPLLSSIVKIYCLTLIIGSLGVINSIRMTIELKYKLKNKIAIISAIISGVVGIVCAYCGMGVWCLIIQQIVSSSIASILVMYYERWFPKLIFSVDSFKRLFGYGSKLLGSNIIHTAYSEMYPLVIGKQFSAADLAFVSRAKGMNDIAGDTISGILASVAFPVLTRIQDDNDQLLRVYGRYLQISIFLIAPIVLFLSGIAKPLILLLLTEKWAPSILLMQILAVNQITGAVTKINLNLLYVKGRSDLVFKLEVIKKSIAFAILICSVLIGNLIVYCCGMTFYTLIAVYLNTIYTKKILNYGFKKQFIEIWPYIWRSILVMVIALVSSYFIANYILSLVVSTMICVPLYIILCRNGKLYAMREVIQIITPKLGGFGMMLKEWVN